MMKLLNKHRKYRIIKKRQWFSDTNDLLEADVEQLGSKINLKLENLSKNITNCFL
jgi:hypothetical protein